jgi:hypothetical protein
MPQDEFRPKRDGLPFTMVRCRRMQSHAFNLRFEKHAPLPAVLQRYQRIRVWIIPHTDIAAVAQYLRAGPEKYPELCKSEVRLALRQHHAPARDRVHCIGFCQFIAETKPIHALLRNAFAVASSGISSPRNLLSAKMQPSFFKDAWNFVKSHQHLFTSVSEQHVEPKP